ncbi:MAG: DUF1398 domain-containing protein, partial [Chitinophagaceae bacterium]
MKKLTVEDIREVEQRTSGKPYPLFVAALKDIGIDQYEVSLKNHDRIFTYAIKETLTIPGHFADDLACSE